MFKAINSRIDREVLKFLGVKGNVKVREWYYRDHNGNFKFEDNNKYGRSIPVANIYSKLKLFNNQ